MQTTGTMQERIAQINEMLSRHHKYRERFVQGCIYAQKTSEIFLKYIRRSPVKASCRLEHETRITQLKAELRDRQSKILELWVRKKNQLDRCQSFLLLDASAQQARPPLVFSFL